MTLCSICEYEADWWKYDSSPFVRRVSLGPSVRTLPPYGMAWGETCSRCGLTAEVVIE